MPECCVQPTLARVCRIRFIQRACRSASRIRFFPCPPHQRWPESHCRTPTALLYIKFEIRIQLRSFFQGRESQVKYRTPAPALAFPKFPTLTLDSDPLKIKGIKFGCCQNQWKSWCTARSLYFNECFKRNCTISTGIPNLGVWCKKRSNWTCGVGQKILLSTPTLSVVRNRTPGKNLRLRNPGFLKSENPTPVQTPATIDATELQHFLNLSSDVYKDHADSCRK